MEELKTELSQYGLVTDCIDVNKKITIKIKLHKGSTLDSSIKCLHIINQFYGECTAKKSLFMNDEVFEYTAIQNG